MKKRLIALLSLLACLCLLRVDSASAADVSAGNCAREKLSRCNITTLLTNRYTEGRPVIIFFPGYDEATSNKNLINFIRNYHLYDDVEIDLVAVTLRGSTPWHRDWEPACRDLYDFLKDKYAASPFPIVVDSLSLGGYGGCWLTEYFRKNGIPVRELNLADACGSWCISADWLRELAAGGTRVNIWGCGGSLNISKDTRAIIAELEGTENIQCVTMASSHGAVLSNAIHEYGLHAEYAVKQEESDEQTEQTEQTE